MADPLLLGAQGARILQVHPTLRCNLRCRHCYSESSPSRRGALPLDGLVRFCGEAAGLGYRYVGVSGGEPLLWDELEPFLEAAGAAGLSTAVTTNGTLLTPARATMLGRRARIVAVSVDGPPAEHAAMRGSANAFEAMRRGLRALREAGVPFALVFTLTRYNAGHLAWVYELADAEGAAAVQVHPLSEVGNAAGQLRGAAPDTTELLAASWLLALLREQRGEGGPAVVLDAVRRATVERSCWPLLADAPVLAGARFADLVPSLVVEPDGAIVPFTYGFPRAWAVGRVGAEPLAELADAWRARHAASLGGHARAALTALERAGEELVDLFPAVAAQAG